MSNILQIYDLYLLFKVNRLIVPFSAFLAGFIISNSGNFIYLFIGFASMLFVYASAATLNDIIDIRIDKISNPERPLPSKKISVGKAIATSVILGLLGLGLAYLTKNSSTGLLFFFLMCIELFLGILYAFYFSNNFFTANSTLGFSHGLIPFFSSLLLFNGMILQQQILIGFAIWVVLFLNYNLKDFKDFEGDLFSRKTLPGLLGVEKAKWIGNWFLSAPLFFSIIVYIVDFSLFGFLLSGSISIFMLLLGRELRDSDSKRKYISVLNKFRFMVAAWIISLIF